jgi:Glycosyltransferase family 87
MVLHTLIVNLFKYIALLVGVAVVVRARASAFLLKSLIGVTLAVFLIHLCAVSRHDLFGFDLQIFWKAGCDVWAGLDPYAPARFPEHPFLNPPTSLPLFALFATLPLRTSLGLWTVLNVLLTLGLVVLARYALIAQNQLDSGGDHEEPELRKLDAVQIAALAVCLLFSDSSLMGLYLGQFNVFVAVMVLSALAAQGRGRPVLAGIFLALATVKFVTMIPFLILFRRRADRLTWVVLMASVLGLCAPTGRIYELPARVATLAQRAEELASPGRVNDYSYDGTRNEGIISFEHVFYRLGMRDRDWIRCSQFLALLALSGWVGYLVVLKEMPRPASACLVSLFSLLFLYHRDYDTLILALPLVHCAGRVSATTGRVRRLYVTCGMLLIVVLFMNAAYLRPLTRLSLEWGGWGRLVQATILPYPTWLIFLAMVLLVRATRLAPAPITGEREQADASAQCQERATVVPVRVPV